MSSCVRNIRTKNYQNLVIGFQVTAKNVGDVFLGHSVEIRSVERGICPIATLYSLAAAYKEGRCKQDAVIFHGGRVVVILYQNSLPWQQGSAGEKFKRNRRIACVRK